MKRRFLLLCVVLVCAIGMYGQNKIEKLHLPVVALKTNALYWATTTPNLSLELGLARKLTLDILGTYNPWEFSGDKKVKHWLIQPELRLWTCERFNGHFFGLHGHYAEFNMGGVKMLGFEHNRYQGHLYGGGISYGYQWIISNHFSVEATIGVGYARIKYDKYECGECGAKLKEDTKNYWGPTKVGVSLIYVIK